MTVPFEYTTRIRPDWIDYNGHMQDAFYGLVFSYAVDALQDAVGLDAAYRAQSGCTIYLIEDHKRFLKEVKEGAEVRVAMHVIGLTDKCFHLWAAMYHGDDMVAVAEMIEMHVRQDPVPHGVPLPDDIHARLATALLPEKQVEGLRFRSRALSL